VLLILPTSAGGCGSGDDAIVGTWAEVGDVWKEYEFRSDGVMVKRFMVNGAEEESTYSVKDGKLELSSDQVAYDYYLTKEDRLTISFEDSVILDLVRKE